jgi:hypothetical protein
VVFGLVCEFIFALHLTLYGVTKRVTAVTKRETGAKKLKKRVRMALGVAVKSGTACLPCVVAAVVGGTDFGFRYDSRVLKACPAPKDDSIEDYTTVHYIGIIYLTNPQYSVSLTV